MGAWSMARVLRQRIEYVPSLYIHDSNKKLLTMTPLFFFQKIAIYTDMHDIIKIQALSH